MQPPPQPNRNPINADMQQKSGRTNATMAASPHIIISGAQMDIQNPADQIKEYAAEKGVSVNAACNDV